MFLSFLIQYLQQFYVLRITKMNIPSRQRLFQEPCDPPLVDFFDVSERCLLCCPNRNIRFFVFFTNSNLVLSIAYSNRYPVSQGLRSPCTSFDRNNFEDDSFKVFFSHWLTIRFSQLQTPM